MSDEEVQTMTKEEADQKAASLIQQIRDIGGVPSVTDEGAVPIRDQFKVRNWPLAYRRAKMIMWPLWTGYLRRVRVLDGKDRSGQPKWREDVIPEIKTVPCGPNHNGGAGIDHYIRTKNWKRVSEMPEEYAEFAAPYRDAMIKLVEQEQSRLRRLQELVELGLAKPARAKIDPSHIAIVSGTAF